MSRRSVSHARYPHADTDMRRSEAASCVPAGNRGGDMCLCCHGQPGPRQASRRRSRRETSTSTQAGITAQPGRGIAGQRFTGVAARVLSRPSAVRGTDGRLHIVYELVLTDMTPFLVDVERVDIRDGKTHRVLQSLAGRALSPG